MLSHMFILIKMLISSVCSADYFLLWWNHHIKSYSYIESDRCFYTLTISIQLLILVMIVNYIKVLNGRNEGGLNKLRDRHRRWIPKTLIHSRSPFPHCIIATGFTVPTYTFFCTAASRHAVITCAQTHAHMWVEQQMRAAPTSMSEPLQTSVSVYTKTLCNTCQLLKIGSCNICYIYNISICSKILSPSVWRNMEDIQEVKLMWQTDRL